MALDYREIKKTIIDTIQLAIGSDLAQTTNPQTQATYGMVLLARPSPEKAIPDYPYAVLDMTMERDDDWYLTNMNFDTVLDKHEYQTVKQLDFQVSIYGATAFSLAAKLKTAYRRDEVLETLFLGGLGLVDVENVMIQPELLQTDFLEASFVRLSVRVNDIDVDLNLESIENVIMTGSLYSNEDDFNNEVNPITITVDTTA